MKIAIAASGETLDAPFAPRFGRAANFIIFDTETEKWTTYPNPASKAGSSAGVQAARFVADKGVQAVISDDFGPHAAKALTAAGIKMFLVGGTVRELLTRYRQGQLKPRPTSADRKVQPAEAPCFPEWEGY